MVAKMTEEKRLHFLDLVDSIMFQGYKSYQGQTEYQLASLQKVNILIGKNNSGKSSILDVVETIVNQSAPRMRKVSIKGAHCFAIYNEVNAKEDRRCQRETPFPGINASLTFSRNLETPCVICESEFKRLSLLFYLRATSHKTLFQNYAPTKWLINYTTLLNQKFENISFRRLAADRDIRSEPESDTENLGFDGDGATNYIRRLLLHENHEGLVIKRMLLEALNEIMKTDGEFADIHVLQLEKKVGDQHLWEVFLEEKSQSRRFALSGCGSGLKTIILTLLNLLVVPYVEKEAKKSYVFAFEELENNLHPALQRRLFKYIENFASKNNAVIFITTHSNVAINAFYGKPDTAFYQVTRASEGSCIARVSEPTSAVNVLNDLGVRAADILQTNGVIWVEGPSDRIYIERWLQIYQETENVKPRVREGFDYQYLYYGGRLLAHYSADLENTAQGLIEIFKINTNAIVVMDSDCIEGTKKDVNATKKRIRDELQSSSTSYCWITSTKEIENFVAPELWQEEFNTKVALDPKESFNKYYQEVNKKRKPTTPPKVELAHKIIEKITSQNWNQHGLKNVIADIYKHICIWNAEPSV
ncbi:MAG: AAA family ATPase [Thermoguttaceae bacterium]|nr:AAA family ATPase [Thermoguttaceae bacterium]